jgi:sulfur-oxidizing protein SoxY
MFALSAPRSESRNVFMTPRPFAGRSMERFEWNGRREILKRGGLLALLVSCGLSSGRQVQAAGETLGFDATSMPDAFRALGGMPAAGADIALTIPDLVENGAMVPVAVSSALLGTQEICIVVESNPYPLVVRFMVSEGTEPFISTRVKMAQSGAVYAVVKAGDQLYYAAKDTKVTVGGCGG